MTSTIALETQGISDDWSVANGQFEPRPRGALSREQVVSAMLHLAPLDTPPMDDPCPPHIQTTGPAGSFSFTGQGGSIFCIETGTVVSAAQAADLAFGKTTLAPPPPMPASGPARRPVNPPAAENTSASHVRKKRSFGWRGVVLLLLAFCFLAAAVTAGFGVISMQSRGVSGDDILAALVIGGLLGFVGIMLVYLAFKIRRTGFVDSTGKPVAEDGSALPFVVMAQTFGDYDDDYGGDDFD